MKALLACLFLVGCASAPLPQAVTQREQYAEMPIRWLVTDNVEQHCGKLHPEGCALMHQDVCTIVAGMPRAFLDHRALEIVGHEVWHCFHGAVHD